MSAVRIVWVLLLAIPVTSFSQEIANITKETKIVKSTLSKTESSHAKQWKLSDKEYERYKEILRSPRGYYTPNLDKNPLLALSLEEESPQKRQDYADRWVQIEFDNAVKVISWQLEVSRSWKRQFPGVPRFSYKDPATAHNAISNMGKRNNVQFSPNPINNNANFDSVIAPRAQLYIRINNCKDCVLSFKKQLNAARVGKISGVDVHFIGNPNKENIGRWAIGNGLSVEDVNNTRIVTLNLTDKKISKVPKVEFIR